MLSTLVALNLPQAVIISISLAIATYHLVRLFKKGQKKDLRRQEQFVSAIQRKGFSKDERNDLYVEQSVALWLGGIIPIQLITWAEKQSLDSSKKASFSLVLQDIQKSKIALDLDASIRDNKPIWKSDCDSVVKLKRKAFWRAVAYFVVATIGFVFAWCSLLQGLPGNSQIIVAFLIVALFLTLGILLLNEGSSYQTATRLFRYTD
jgi:hypothetical protein